MKDSAESEPTRAKVPPAGSRLPTHIPSATPSVEAWATAAPMKIWSCATTITPTTDSARPISQPAR